VKVIYPIKTLNQLPLVLKGFRKEKGLTQAAIAERLGISQQSYAYFEANPATATLERLYMVLRILDVEISLSPSSLSAKKGVADSVRVSNKSSSATKVTSKKTGKAPGAAAIRKAKPSAIGKAGRIATPTRRKESW
jgi:HTH-type transcriptional regulator/antitoxin HipB